MNKIVVGTGWYSDSQRHRRYRNRSKLTFEQQWFQDYWIPQIQSFIDPYFYFYICDCEIKPLFNEKQIMWWNSNVNIVLATQEASFLDHRHGFHSSIMNSLQFALTEGMDYFYIENDCFVHNLDKCYEWAKQNIKDKAIIYHCGAYSFSPGWAEQSFMFVPNNSISFVLDKLNRSRIHETKGNPMPEVLWHQLFKNYYLSWEFGYGRHNVLNWNKDEMFFKQQLTDNEINNFIKLRND